MNDPSSLFIQELKTWLDYKILLRHPFKVYVRKLPATTKITELEELRT